MRLKDLLTSTAMTPAWAPENGGAGGGGDGGGDGGQGGRQGAGGGLSQHAGGGDGGGDGGQGGQGGGDGGAGGGNGQQQQQATWTPPQDLPDQFKGENADEVLGKVLPAYKGLRDQLAKQPKAPEKPDAYTFKPADNIAPYFPDADKDPGIAVAKQVFHKHGIPQAAFEGIINEVFGGMAEQGLMAEPFNPQKEIETYGKAFGLDKASIGTAMAENETFANGLFEQLTEIPEDLKTSAKAEFLMLRDSAGGQAVLRALSARLADSGIRIDAGQGSSAKMSPEEARKLTSDPRIDPANKDNPDPNKRYDPDLRRQYDEAYSRMPAPQRAF